MDHYQLGVLPQLRMFLVQSPGQVKAKVIKNGAPCLLCCTQYFGFDHPMIHCSLSDDQQDFNL